MITPQSPSELNSELQVFEYCSNHYIQLMLISTPFLSSFTSFFTIELYWSPFLTLELSQCQS